ncbi:MAG: dehypoxanthine futalosine cyclase [Nitrospirae bacterium CG_4_10_14_0_8_um_filter_41_23]|nr:dehypoxanthine futalosine cyclase [Nitrospirota bacterium]OIP61372.1 MAG: dehypoxanthine futalosine cyclase [Nitrospirae bacterium CG2_30_41_42]PIQ94581.1 MAG: dehypoxanthine futalosine cyclase [Nitrospirae bacterium CG11_big_fil_rev_8_21_14_0_20_41_14]PIV41306.1 MAG: dehypoxanthine futalosine cyclase [Nitrospirae bacterium CG02_land_8_20_14_3_00_41_53]PIW87693.1 MAG: dehypoxanthine futalosine cyclase [Nitrospirae bacterium CG_4_8_14_3_um_filter_41_47]PIY86547.1 MAG: dehypoxanthine futalosi
MKIRQIFDKTSEGKRLSFDEAVLLFKTADILELARAAEDICDKKHPERMATFQIDRNINYTNICKNQCSFCAFFRHKGHPEAYVLSQKEIENKVAETIKLSGTQVMLQGGINPDLNIDYYINMFSEIKKKFRIRIHSLSPPEVVYLAESSKMSISETLKELMKAGLDSLPGGGAEILVDHVRQRISPRKISSSQWMEVMDEAHNLGLKTTATMMIGTVEAIEDRITHLQKIRDLQDRTGGFLSFISWTFQPRNTALGGKSISSIEYLKTLSVSRLFLDNFLNVQGSWVTQGKNIGQICLSFGANDLGSIMIEENVVRAAGVFHRITVDEMVDLIRKAGKIPAQRDTEFNILKVYD